MRRVLLVACLVISLVLLTMYSREGQDGPIHGAQNAVSGIIAPLSLVGAAVGTSADSVGEGIENITADESTLSGLRDANAELVEQLAQAEEYRQEAQRLQGLLNLKDAYDIEGAGARVIGRSTTAWDQTVTIDKGSADGVDSGLTVMGASGVVGQVVGTTEHASTVRLLSDPKSGAAAFLQSTRAEGIVRGSYDGLLYLEDLDADAAVQVGDIVITSGLGGSYTRGLAIGTVVKVDAQSGDATHRVVVSPTDEADALEEVLVVFSVGSSAAGSSDSEDAGEGGGES